MRPSHKTVIAIFVMVTILCIAAVFSSDERGGAGGTSSTTYRKAIRYLGGKLIMEKPVVEPLSGRSSDNVTSIYVLGGNQESLIPRFRKASILYHQGFSRKILILDRPGITEFSPELGRNLTNNEWSFRELEKLKVRREDIETVAVRARFFGTLSEAKDVSDSVRRKESDRLILVTSDYHTKRAYNAFLTYSPNNSRELYIYGSGDTYGLRILLPEYVKLLLYDYFVIPFIGHAPVSRHGSLMYC